MENNRQNSYNAHETERSYHTNHNIENEDNRRLDVELGNPELPIYEFKDLITDTVESNQVSIVTAETGAGKSTQIPQFLAEAGYDVIVTQPRVVAARELALRVDEEVTIVAGDDCKDLVGYKTAHEGRESEDNRIKYVTDGLQVVHELMAKKESVSDEKTVLVLDEIHEWNENMEVLIAWSKLQMKQNPDFKVVGMSATMDAGPLADFFADGDSDSPTPIIDVPGRTFPVEKNHIECGRSEVFQTCANQAVELAAEGKNSLVFVPGKAEVNEVIAGIEKSNVAAGIDAEVLALHGQLDSSDQRKVFKQYDKPKIVVSTNIAETSVTIDDIDAVIDSGLERRVEVQSGVEGLFLRDVPQDSLAQRAGRAGRTKEGEYYLVSPIAAKDRSEYRTPEIRRRHLDGLVLRLTAAGLDAENMEFFHQPKASEIVLAKEKLKKLGALNEDGELTAIGKKMEKMPLSANYARMMVEAEKYKKPVRAQLAAAVAAMEAGGLSFWDNNKALSDQPSRKLANNEYRSDFIGEMQLYIAGGKMKYKDRKQNGINNRNFNRAGDIHKKICEKYRLPKYVNAPNKEQLDQVYECIVAGMVDSLYARGERGNYTSHRRDDRQIERRSLANEGGDPRLVVGTPRDIQTRRGGIIDVIQNVTPVSLETLKKVAPQLWKTGDSKLSSSLKDRIQSYRNIMFDGVYVGMVEDPVPATNEVANMLANMTYNSNRDDHEMTIARSGQLANYLSSSSGDYFRVAFDEWNMRQVIRYNTLPNMTTVSEVEQSLDKSGMLDVQPEDLMIVPDKYVDEDGKKLTSRQAVELVESQRLSQIDGYAVEGYKNGSPILSLDDEEILNYSGPQELDNGHEILFRRKMIGFFEYKFAELKEIVTEYDATNRIIEAVKDSGFECVGRRIDGRSQPIVIFSDIEDLLQYTGPTTSPDGGAIYVEHSSSFEYNGRRLDEVLEIAHERAKEKAELEAKLKAEAEAEEARRHAELVAERKKQAEREAVRIAEQAEREALRVAERKAQAEREAVRIAAENRRLSQEYLDNRYSTHATEQREVYTTTNDNSVDKGNNPFAALKGMMGSESSNSESQKKNRMTKKQAQRIAKAEAIKQKQQAEKAQSSERPKLTPAEELAAFFNNK